MGQNTSILAVPLASLWLAGNFCGERIDAALCLGGDEEGMSPSHTLLVVGGLVHMLPHNLCMMSVFEVFSHAFPSFYTAKGVMLNILNVEPKAC